ncbi:MAG: glycosyltransferase family 2 protein [Quinella sp. 1Q7]|nr:glycosyltransferase family 2 protein [Quinella sp. 1Q7]
MDTPKISVIIPMYNAERFIRQTLISVLASKFADYEVIVVDDCSTDSSVAEAEKLLPHFDGRLKIFSTQTNSGGAGVPRNIAIKNSAGKYITFLDADDFLLPTALADFYGVAEEYQADVVHTEKFFGFKDAGQQNFKREELKLLKYEAGECVEMPTLEPPDLRGRLQRCIDGKFIWMPWSKLYRRDFLLENRIDFPDMKLTEDLVFCFRCLCFAENYVRVPHVTNVYRMNQNSVSKRPMTPTDGVKLWLSSLTEGVRRIYDFLESREDFRRDSQLQYLAAKFLVPTYFSFIRNLFTGLEPHEVLKIFYDELQNPALDPKGKDIVAAYLLAERALIR